MISKEEAREKIKKAGYNVVDDNSVLTILIPEKASVKNTVKAVKELLLKIDYQASFGVKQHSKSNEEMMADSEADLSTDIETDFIENETPDIEADFVENGMTDIDADLNEEAMGWKTTVEKKSDEKASLAEKKSDEKASLAEKKSDEKASLAEKKSDEKASLAEKKSGEKASLAEKKSAKKTSQVEKTSVKKTPKKVEVKEETEEDDFLDDEDESFDEGSISLDDYDMDMMLNEKSIQFSLEDFGLI